MDSIDKAKELADEVAAKTKAAADLQEKAARPVEKAKE